MKFLAVLLIYLLTSGIFLTSPYQPNPALRQTHLEPTLDGKLEKPIHDFRTAGRTLIATLVDLAYEYQLPMGIEYLDREAATRPIHLEFHDQPLRGILMAVVAQLPEYRVTF